MLYIFVKLINNRIEYIFDLFFTHLLKVEYTVTSDIEEFSNYKGPKLNYSDLKIKGVPFLLPHSLLFEKNITDHQPKVTESKNGKIFFQSGNSSIFEFDLFAATFWLVSRYEEYFPYPSDIHGRFTASNSLAYKYRFLQTPIVNQWAMLLSEKLNEFFPTLKITKPSSEFISTIDIDNAWAFKNKGFKRTAGALIRSLGTGDINGFFCRLNVLLGTNKDPYDTYTYIRNIHLKFKCPLRIFWLLGDYGPFDKNIKWKNPAFQEQIMNTMEYASIGIHPSYATNKKYVQLKKEVDRLSSIRQKRVTRSRQHYLVLRLPETYRQLIKAGIKEDYSMGYADQPGFRAGICTPFYFFDLEANKKTDLKIFPFAFMDGTFKHHRKDNPEDAAMIIEKIINEVKKVKGTLISLWHNESINNWGEWKGWKNVFEQTLELGATLNYDDRNKIPEE